ncbi:MAG TPA: hypothetical protein ENN69_06100 [Spirochaetia bacterium]|nr:hypothetical protein [Spirochaetia bacterium]
MQYIFCDSCKKQVKEPMRDVNYVTVLDHALCDRCQDQYNRKVSSTMSGKKKYSFLEHKKVQTDVLGKMCR